MLHPTFRIGLLRSPGYPALGKFSIAGSIASSQLRNGSTGSSIRLAASKPSPSANQLTSFDLTSPYQSLYKCLSSRLAQSYTVRARQISTTRAVFAQRIQPGTTAAPNSSLDWNSFFKLRTSRRRFSLVSSIISSIAVTGAAFVFLSTQPELADEITKLVPMDPVISMGIMTFAATLLGWLIGPVFGNTLWKLVSRSRLPEFTIKERAFFERIKKHRVNPQGASTNNPVPDYYGEKIGSVRDYRRWLKDQRAFNRKKEGSYPDGI